jgi:Domain of unknown function (DUF4194)
MSEQPTGELECADSAPLEAAPQLDLTAVAVPLLKGVIYRDEEPQLWAAVLGLQSRVRDFMAVLALELVLDEAEGYAFLQSIPQADEGDNPKMPRLVRRQPLTFHLSLLLALLRKKLAEFDASSGDARLIVSRDAVVETIRVFLPAGSNESKLIDNVDALLNKAIELGFVRRLKPPSSGQEAMFEVRRILKAFVDAQWLAEFDQRLAAYLAQLAQPNAERDDDQP